MNNFFIWHQIIWNLLVSNLISRKCPSFRFLNSTSVKHWLAFLSEVNGLNYPNRFMSIWNNSQRTIIAKIYQNEWRFEIFIHTIQNHTWIVMVQGHQNYITHAIYKKLLKNIFTVNLPHDNSRPIKPRMSSNHGSIVVGNLYLSDFIQ